MLVWCAVAFYRQGQGTLAPWSPPRLLVTEGVYALTRNPMYVAVVLMLLGWAVLFRSSVLALYAVTVAIAFHLRVVVGEETWLAKTYGVHWQQYKARVPRWLPNPFRQRSKNAA
jgi:protein-S-isoprenylcysteine O-methyltransferase Ste14